MIELISTKGIARSMLISRYAMRILTAIAAMFLMSYMISGSVKFAFIGLFAFIAAVSLETDNKINALRMEIRKDNDT